MIRPWEAFQHCPACGLRQAGAGASPLRCGGCGFVHYFNPVCAVAGFVFDEQGRCLFIRRAREPGAGMLALPGGFVDVGETAEACLHREIAEEVGLEVDVSGFVGSWPNDYRTPHFTVPVLDFFFTALVRPGGVVRQAPDEVSGHEWLDARRVAPESLAFPSMHAALRAWQAGGRGHQ